MTSPSAEFDWDHAVGLFLSHMEADAENRLLRNPHTIEKLENARTNCASAVDLNIEDAAGAVSEQPRCKKGLHVLATDADVYVSSRTGHRRCRACVQASREQRKNKPKPKPEPKPLKLAKPTTVEVVQPAESDVWLLDQEIGAAEEAFRVAQQNSQDAWERYNDATAVLEDAGKLLHELRVKRETIEVPMCRNGLHAMVASNTYVNPTTGHRRCRACVQQTKKWR